MLALLLENRDVGGTPAYELFRQKCADNEILAADLRKAVSIPSRSILFNIDQKADVISKEQIDALLSVFQKVFDEMCGYYGKQPHIAQFERDLDSRGVLEKFQRPTRLLQASRGSGGANKPCWKARTSPGLMPRRREPIRQRRRES